MTDDELDEFLEQRRVFLRDRMNGLLAEMRQLGEELVAVELAQQPERPQLRVINGGRH